MTSSNIQALKHKRSIKHRFAEFTTRIFKSIYWKITVVLMLFVLASWIIQLFIAAHYSLKYYGGQNVEPFSALAQKVQESYTFGIIALILVTLIFVAAFIDLLSYYFLATRFKAVAKVIRRFAAGDYSQRVSIQTKDEAGLIGQAFNEMADTVVASIETLRRSDALRRELIANIAHDLNSPLTHIYGYLETIIIKHDKLSAEERLEFLKICLESTQSLIELVEELLELSKLDAGVEPFEKKWFSLKDIVEDVVRLHSGPATSKSISIIVEQPDHLPLVLGDPALITRALSNIVDNAVKYTERGGKITLSLQKQTYKISVSVSDTGRGIPYSEQSAVFERFYRVEKDRSPTGGGAGLGLAISKKILDLHGEELKLTSRPGHGTKLFFCLPSQ
ncbi:MAG: sensor histidine kinase [Candidatus Dadabacteria bacterium]|nr:MAG: sensor histidine kinase [Candidatus Dadabacteria bacterium]